MKNDSHNLMSFVNKKISFYRNVIQKTLIHVRQNKMNDVLAISEYSLCVNKLNDISKMLLEIDASLISISTKDNIIKKLQEVNNNIAAIFKEYGTLQFSDLLTTCIGEYYHADNLIFNKEKLDLLKEYFHPISYKIITKKTDIKFKKKDASVETFSQDVDFNYECYDISSEFKSFYVKVYGIKVILNCDDKKDIIIYGIIDDIFIELIKSQFIYNINLYIENNIPDQPDFYSESFSQYLKSLTLKDYLICKCNSDIFTKYYGYLSFNNTIKEKHISQTVKEFSKDDLYGKRNTLIMLLLNNGNVEHDYLAYLLYDILSNDVNGGVDNHEQIVLFDSLPLVIKNNFKTAMKKTINYTNDITNYDSNKIPLEQQICLLNTDSKVKEKALMKLKEVKNKSEDSGVKARQYIEGLLKIPFNIYKKEPILYTIKDITSDINCICKKYDKYIDISHEDTDIKTTLDVINFYKKCEKQLNSSSRLYVDLNELIEHITTFDKKKLLSTLTNIQYYIAENELYNFTINKKVTKKIDILNEIINCMKELVKENKTVFYEIYYFIFKDKCEFSKMMIKLDKKIYDLKTYFDSVKSTLDKSVHGHDNAKRQIQRIIGQWINNNGISYDCQVLGFEGNPGIGKTTLAKGLSRCLLDDDNNSRPFSIIAMGGDSNASSLVGHSYTYVGSNWGQIVQILMDNKCLNPIILIDEVDKISKTEHGREIVGVLTHLLDPSQNKHFQDKYFSGIDIDLSKVLFILSYNDPQSLDPIMLDRVHRIKFDSLSVEDKVIICNKYLLPELYKNFNLVECITIPDDVIKFIINEYTLEPGVRKLKEKLFEIIGELNLNLYTNFNVDEIPITITEEMIKTQYFKDKRQMKITRIHNSSTVGLINALWANEMGQGGILPLQVSFYPSNSFLSLKLTGSLGDVMKESINVSLTTAWSLCSESVKKQIIEKYNNPTENSVYGLHVHCPGISTKKDGPSATTAFTVIIYSLFNNIKIKNTFGITGETSFDYKLTEIGGLREKIIYSIPAGITNFIFPSENKTDFDKILEKYSNSEILSGVNFHSLDNISQVLDLILEK